MIAARLLLSAVVFWTHGVVAAFPAGNSSDLRLSEGTSRLFQTPHETEASRFYAKFFQPPTKAPDNSGLEVCVGTHLPFDLEETFHREQTYRLAMQLLKQRRAKTLVETGTTRWNGDGAVRDQGASTAVWSAVADCLDAEMWTVSDNKQTLNSAMSLLQQQRGGTPSERVKFFHGNSIKFLLDFARPLDLLYLDAGDYDSVNPQASQQLILEEVKAAYGKLHKDTVIVLDDCDLPSGGKCQLAADYLVNERKQWRVLMAKYQLVLVMTTSSVPTEKPAQPPRATPPPKLAATPSTPTPLPLSSEDRTDTLNQKTLDLKPLPLMVDAPAPKMTQFKRPKAIRPPLEQPKDKSTAPTATPTATSTRDWGQQLIPVKKVEQPEKKAQTEQEYILMQKEKAKQARERLLQQQSSGANDDPNAKLIKPQSQRQFQPQPVKFEFHDAVAAARKQAEDRL